MDKKQYLEQRVVDYERMGRAMEFCSGAIEIGGQKLAPDETKGYVDFALAHGLTTWEKDGVRHAGGITAYGTALHPATVAAHYGSMLHQVLDYDHRMKIHGPAGDNKTDARDRVLGCIVGVELRRGTGEMAGNGCTWKLGKEENGGNYIRGVAAVFKKAEGVPALLGEHMGGRHQWTVSMELDYSLAESGFAIWPKGEKDSKHQEMCGGSQEEFRMAGLAYVPCMAADDDLLGLYSFDERKVTGPWQGRQVVLVKGGIGGPVHFSGVGLVRYGAEREAVIQNFMASDAAANRLAEAVAKMEAEGRKMLEMLRGDA